MELTASRTGSLLIDVVFVVQRDPQNRVGFEP